MRDQRAAETKRVEPDFGGWREGELLALAATSLVVGLAVGGLSASFRLLLVEADRLRDGLVTWAHSFGGGGLLLPVLLCAAAATIAAWLVRRFSPYASGSGIPHVENVLREELPPAPASLILIKFFGGVLAIGGGLALGREGPSVQMGATIGNLFGQSFGLPWRTRRVLLAAGAGAGLAAAFNAPVAGAVFVLEELVRQFELHVAIAALGASATAIWASQAILGPAPDFHVEALAFADPRSSPLYFIFGAVAGTVAVIYCRALLVAIAAAKRLDQLRPELSAALVGAAVGGLAWFAPNLVGGGDDLTQLALLAPQALPGLSLVFVLRFALGPASYATGAPGGIFAPMLVLGAQLGLIYGQICSLARPDLIVQPVAFALVGMAAFFAAVVRAPLTAIVLVTEMTSDATLLLPMLAASFCAMVAPTFAREPPIYDSLRERALPGRQETGIPQSEDAFEPPPAPLPQEGAE